MEDVLTLFYMKSTGKIKGFCSGKQDMNYFGEDKEDFKLIIDFIQVEYNSFIIRNLDYYRVENDKLIFTKEGEL